jgi:hypothetical protein
MTGEVIGYCVDRTPDWVTPLLVPRTNSPSNRITIQTKLQTKLSYRLVTVQKKSLPCNNLERNTGFTFLLQILFSPLVVVVAVLCDSKLSLFGQILFLLTATRERYLIDLESSYPNSCSSSVLPGPQNREPEP